MIETVDRSVHRVTQTTSAQAASDTCLSVIALRFHPRISTETALKLTYSLRKDGLLIEPRLAYRNVHADTEP
jgi:hypothetical protein